MIPNYMQAWGLGRAYADGADAFHLVKQETAGQYRWALDLEDLERAVSPGTNVILVTKELINRLRVEQSVLLTAGDQHGLDKGLRIGFGCGIEKTLKGLARVETLMRSLQ
jgi:hypothetical protein